MLVNVLGTGGAGTAIYAALLTPASPCLLHSPNAPEARGPFLIPDELFQQAWVRAAWHPPIHG